MMRSYALALAMILTPVLTSAQTIGTFRWQLQAFCNVVTLTVTQNSGIFTLDGFDDQCGAATRAPVTGLAAPNPNGTIELGLNIVVSPSGAPVHVATAISPATLGGTWRDSTGATGNFVFTPGNGTGGSPRPVPTATVIPSAFMLRTDGGFLAEGTFNVGTIPDAGPGVRMMWHPRKAAFRVGRVDADAWDDGNIGNESVAFNKNTRATATFSAAFGDSTLASGNVSTAMGFFTTASGIVSTAIGSVTTASGQASTATGNLTIASGANSFAAGFQTAAGGTNAAVFGHQSLADGIASFSAGRDTYANGNNTVALGSFARALAAGSFVFGDASTTAILFAPAPNTFTVRADGGTRFFSNAAMTAGVVLATGGGAFSSLSDVNMKANFRDLNADDVLMRIARMPIREWNYTTQDAGIRHVGPTAQDFHAAFGLGEDRLRINTIDADGIALRAIQALESRTRTADEHTRALEAELVALRERFAQLEQLLLEKR
jgi:hypothetical protein